MCSPPFPEKGTMVLPLPDKVLKIRFTDGTTKLYDMKPDIEKNRVWKKDLDEMIASGKLAERFTDGSVDLKGTIESYEDHAKLEDDHYFNQVTKYPCFGIQWDFSEDIDESIEAAWYEGKEIPTKSDKMTDEENDLAQETENRFFASRRLKRGYRWVYEGFPPNPGQHDRHFKSWKLYGPRKFRFEVEIHDLEWKDGYTIYLAMDKITMRGEVSPDRLFEAVGEMEILVGAAKTP